MIEKQCGRCREFLPATAFNVDRAQPDGLHGYCKPCRRETRRARANVETKCCSTCGELKPVAAFAWRPDSPDGLQYNCRECSAEIARRWHAGRPDRLLRQNPLPAVNRDWIGWRLAA
jgi:hypothetical protein